MAIETSDIYKLAAHHRFQWEKAQDCYVILFPEGMVKLNESAGNVLKLVNGESNVELITNTLIKEFPGAPDIAKKVVGMIELALEKAWIEKIN
jgi:pyrroloquinoline quinone biosynthesis protein D